MLTKAEEMEAYKDYCSGFLMTPEEYWQYQCDEMEYLAEQQAENAWLTHAEIPTEEDYAFEKYERDMGLLSFGEASGRHFCSKRDIREVE